MACLVKLTKQTKEIVYLNVNFVGVGKEAYVGNTNSKKTKKNRSVYIGIQSRD
jgi:hypothetical protein